MGLPSASAALRGFKSTIPAPSARAKPFALASNALQRPSGESMEADPRAMWAIGDRIALTPPASAVEQLRSQRLWQARWIALNADEQAVSSAMLGPDRFRQ